MVAACAFMYSVFTHYLMYCEATATGASAGNTAAPMLMAGLATLVATFLMFCQGLLRNPFWAGAPAIFMDEEEKAIC